MPLQVMEPPLLSGPASDIHSRADIIAEKQKTPDMLELADLAWGSWLGYYNTQVGQLVV